MKFVLPFLTAVILWTPSVAGAFTPPPNDGYVTDTVGVLTDVEDASLERTLKQYRDETSNEIAILIVDTLYGGAIDIAAVETGRTWGVGGKDRDNGVVILVSYKDREIFLAIGYGLEGVVPDIIAKAIIEKDILPLFREGEYYKGLIAGIDSLQKHIGGEYTAERYVQEKRSIRADVFLFIVLVGLEALAALFSRTKSWWLGGVVGAALGVLLAFIKSWWLAVPIMAALGLLMDYVFSKGATKRRRGAQWYWGGGGGGRGGGGFGGGSFGGGGAGGSW